MHRFLGVALGALFMVLSGTGLFAAPGHGGGRSGGGGHNGGGSLGGGHIGSAGALRGGGSPLGGLSNGGLRSAGPSLPGGGLGGLRTAPNISGFHTPSNPGSLRVSPNTSGLRLPSPSAGNLGTLRVAPSLNNNGVHAPGLVPGSALNSPGSNFLPRTTTDNVRPQLSTILNNSQKAKLPGNRTPLGGPDANGIRLNQGRQLQTNLKPGGANLGALVNPGQTNAKSWQERVTGRATPQNVGKFLSLPGPQGATGNQGFQVNPIVGHSTTIHTFNRLNVNQIKHINTNLNTGFRNFHQHHGHNNGSGFQSFGFGWGSPYWNNWCNGVRGHWNPYGYYGLFSNRFWATNYCSFPYRRSYYYWGSYPYSYWWNTPSWVGLNSWFTGYNWSTPYYYGYGPGGNIVSSDGYVYMNDVPIATTTDYAASAAEIADVPVPVTPDTPAEWLPLGTFALSESEADKSPPRVVQLAVDKEGVISGTMFNKTTNQTFPIQGRVDKETQRVAFTIGNAKDVVFETGIYNLTQQQTPVLVHGEGREETYLLLRLEPPKEGAAATPPAAAAPGTPTDSAINAPGPVTPTPPASGLVP